MFTCQFYKVFDRYLLCCVRIGLDWIQILGHRLDWTGLGSVARGFGLDWIVSTQSIPYSGTYMPLLLLEEKITQAFEENNIVCGLYLDLRKAFDTVNTEILLDKISTGGRAQLR